MVYRQGRGVVPQSGPIWLYEDLAGAKCVTPAAMSVAAVPKLSHAATVKLGAFSGCYLRLPSPPSVNLLPL